MTRRLIVLLVILLAAAAVWFLRPAVRPSVPDEVPRADEEADEAPRLLGRADATRDAGDAGAAPAREDAGGTEGNGPDAARATVYARVLLDGEPAPAGVLVRLGLCDDSLGDEVAGRWQRDARTDERGEVSFEDVEADEVRLCAWSEGYGPDRQYWRRARETRDDPVLLRLTAGPAFDGRVVEATSGAPIPGASVILGSRGFFEVGPTDAAGAFHVQGVSNANEYALTARAPGYVACTLRLRVDSGRIHPSEFVLRLQRGGTLTGTVVSADGLAVEGAEVRIAVQGPDAPQPPSLEPWMWTRARGDTVVVFAAVDGARIVRTGPDGSFRADGLSFDTAYDVSANAEGHARSLVSACVQVTESAPETSVRLTLRRPVRVLLRVLVPEGSRLPSDARVRLFEDVDTYMWDDTDAEGRYVFAGVGPGPAYVYVEAAGFAPASLPIEVEEAETVEAEIRLEAGAAVEGIAVDAEGRPVRGAIVRAGPSAWVRLLGPEVLYLRAPGEATTDEEGRFVVAGLPPGAVVLEAHDRGPRALATRAPVRCTAPAHDLRLVLVSRGAARMRLLLPGGAPYDVPVGVWVGRPDGSGFGYGVDPEDGVLVIDELPDGDYTLVLTPRDQAWILRSVQVREGRTSDLGDVLLGQGRTLSGRVVDETGALVPGAEVGCYENSERSTLTDAEGRFSMDRFPQERVTLYATAPAHILGQVESGPADTTGLRIVLLRAALVRGVLRRPDGTACGDGRITLRPPDAVRGTWLQRHEDGTTTTEVYYEGAEYLRAGDDGRFGQDVRPGAYVGWWTDEAGEEHRLGEWTFEATETYELEITLPAK